MGIHSRMDSFLGCEMSDYTEDFNRYVLAECAETGRTKCFAVIPPAAESEKDPFRRRKYITRYRPRWGLKPLYTTDRGGDWSGLESSPFWKSPRLVKRENIPEGVSIP